MVVFELLEGDLKVSRLGSACGHPVKHERQRCSQFVNIRVDCSLKTGNLDLHLLGPPNQVGQCQLRFHRRPNGRGIRARGEDIGNREPIWEKAILVVRLGRDCASRGIRRFPLVRHRYIAAERHSTQRQLLRKTTTDHS